MLIPKINFRKLQSIYKKKSDKSGQGSLVAVILASVIGTIIISSSTQWFLSMNKTMDRTDDRLEAMSIAMSEWQRLEHMSLDELEANRENYKTPYNVGDKFTVGVNLGGQGFFNNGTCNALTGNYASESPNCFKDTTMTVYDKDGKAIYTTRSLPLSSQGGGGKGLQVDFSKPTNIAIGYDVYTPMSKYPDSMIAPADGVVFVFTTAYSKKNGNGYYHNTGSNCSISGYGTVGGQQFLMVIVNKGASISFSNYGVGRGGEGHATFYPFK